MGGGTSEVMLFIQNNVSLRHGGICCNFMKYILKLDSLAKFRTTCEWEGIWHIFLPGQCEAEVKHLLSFRSSPAEQNPKENSESLQDFSKLCRIKSKHRYCWKSKGVSRDHTKRHFVLTQVLIKERDGNYHIYIKPCYKYGYMIYICVFQDLSLLSCFARSNYWKHHWM